MRKWGAMIESMNTKPAITKLPCGCISQIWECPMTGTVVSGMDLCDRHELELRKRGGYPVREDEAN